MYSNQWNSISQLLYGITVLLFQSSDVCEHTPP